MEEIGEALGVPEEEGEPLRTTDKLERRDRDRWELNPASSEDYNGWTAELNDAKPSEKRKNPPLNQDNLSPNGQIGNAGPRVFNDVPSRLRLIKEIFKRRR